MCYGALLERTGAETMLQPGYECCHTAQAATVPCTLLQPLTRVLLNSLLLSLHCKLHESKLTYLYFSGFALYN